MPEDRRLYEDHGMIDIEHMDDVLKFRLARTFFGKPLYFTACYWVDGLVVDTGCSYTVHELVSALEQKHVTCIVNTHSHEDHFAANAALMERFGVPALAHPLALPVLQNPDRGLTLRPYQKIMWGHPRPCTASGIGTTVETDNHRFEVIHTPGHSPDHISLYERDKGWLFTGDAYIGGLDRALRSDYNIHRIMDSLRKMARLEPRLLFPGSGNIRRDPAEEIRAKIQYLEEMGARAVQLRNRGYGFSRIRKELFGREMPIAYFTLGHFTGRNLVRSFIEDAP